MKSNQRIWAMLLLILGAFITLGFPQLLTERIVRSMVHIELKDYYHPAYDAFMAQAPIIGIVMIVGGLILWYLEGRPAKQ